MGGIGMAGEDSEEGAHWEALGIDEECASRLGLEDVSLSEGKLASRRAQWLSKLESDPKKMTRALFLACALGMGREVDRLLRAGADANATVAKGHTPLMRAAGAGSVEAIAKLIAHGAKRSEVDDRGWTALMWACEEGRLAVVEALATHPDSGVDAISKDGQMALSLAAGFGSEAAARKMCVSLLKGGANLEKLAELGCSALWMSACRGHAQAIRDWVALGLDPKQPDRDGVSPLMIAAVQGHGKACLALMEMGVDAFEPDALGRSPFEAMDFARMGPEDGVKIRAMSTARLENIKLNGLTAQGSMGDAKRL